MSAVERYEGGELVHVEATPVTLFRTENPAEVVQRASEMARELAAVVKKQKLTTKIQGRDYCRVEAWTLLGTMLGVFPICQWTKKVENGWEARVEARTLNGQLIGAAEAQCLRSEKTWEKRDDYALRSMAQTRATSKALRQPLGFVMTLAGFEATPAEEMDFVQGRATVSQPSAEALPHALQPDPNYPSANALASEERVKEVEALIAELHGSGVLPEPEAREGMVAAYKTSVTGELTEAQAYNLAGRLRAKAQKVTGAGDVQ